MGKALEILEQGMELVLEEMKEAPNTENLVGLGGLLSAMADAAANLGEKRRCGGLYPRPHWHDG